MPVPFPSNAFNVNVISSGTGGGIERVGSMPAVSGIKVFKEGFPINPAPTIQQIDPSTGLITVGNSGQPLLFREYPMFVNVWVADASGSGWPTGSGCYILGNKVFTPPPSGTPRGTYYDAQTRGPYH